MIKKIGIFILVTIPQIAVSSPSQYLTVLNVRTYENGFVVRVSETVNPACGYPSTLQLFTNNQNYSASVSLFMTAWASGRPIRAFYGGCGQNNVPTNSGNVHITGWLVNN